MEPVLNDPIQAKEYFDKKLSFTCGPAEVHGWIRKREKINIVDVRAADDYAKGHVPGAIHLPRDRWHSLERLSREKLNVVYCYTAVCHLGAQAARHFAEKGFPVMEMEGGMQAWREYRFETESSTQHQDSHYAPEQ